MAIEKLKTTYIDEVVDTRKYKLTNVGTDEYMIEDVSTVSVEGSTHTASDINDTNVTANAVIDELESNASRITRIKNSGYSLNATSASTANTAQTVDFANIAQTVDYAEHVTTANSATTATNVNSATNAVRANRATKAPSFTVAHKINGTTFSGETSVTVADNTKVEKTKSFVLISKGTLTFDNNVCDISNENITQDSLAYVNFTADTLAVATKSAITVDTYNGYVRLIRKRAISGTIKATIIIRSV